LPPILNIRPRLTQVIARDPMKDARALDHSPRLADPLATLGDQEDGNLRLHPMARHAYSPPSP
jgi:hypothetical protein